MKKIILAVAIVALTTSCSVVTKTARTEGAPYAMYNATVADLDVSSQRITYTLTPSKSIRKAGLENCKQAAVNEALKLNGNADLLVEPQFVIARKLKKVTSVTVTGRPAVYTNFRSLDDAVWCDPVFRQDNKGVTGKQKGVFNRNIFGK